MKVAATVATMNGCFMAMKCEYLVRRSTTIWIELNRLELGSPSMQSIEISSQTCSGIDRGWRSLVGCACKDFYV